MVMSCGASEEFTLAFNVNPISSNFEDVRTNNTTRRNYIVRFTSYLSAHVLAGLVPGIYTRLNLA